MEKNVECECGEVTGEKCPWSGPIDETVIVEHMPEWLRASHEDAENSGVYPHNGAVRARVSAACADMIADDWTEEVK